MAKIPIERPKTPGPNVHEFGSMVFIHSHDLPLHARSMTRESPSGKIIQLPAADPAADLAAIDRGEKQASNQWLNQHHSIVVAQHPDGRVTAARMIGYSPARADESGQGARATIRTGEIPKWLWDSAGNVHETIKKTYGVDKNAVNLHPHGQLELNYPGSPSEFNHVLEIGAPQAQPGPAPKRRGLISRLLGR